MKCDEASPGMGRMATYDMRHTAYDIRHTTYDIRVSVNECAKQECLSHDGWSGNPMLCDWHP